MHLPILLFLTTLSSLAQAKNSPNRGYLMIYGQEQTFLCETGVGNCCKKYNNGVGIECRPSIWSKPPFSFMDGDETFICLKKQKIRWGKGWFRPSHNEPACCTGNPVKVKGKMQSTCHYPESGVYKRDDHALDATPKPASTFNGTTHAGDPYSDPDEEDFWLEEEPSLVDGTPELSYAIEDVTSSDDDEDEDEDPSLPDDTPELSYSVSIEGTMIVQFNFTAEFTCQAQTGWCCDTLSELGLGTNCSQAPEVLELESHEPRYICQEHQQQTQSAACCASSSNNRVTGYETRQCPVHAEILEEELLVVEEIEKREPFGRFNTKGAKREEGKRGKTYVML